MHIILIVLASIAGIAVVVANIGVIISFLIACLAAVITAGLFAGFGIMIYQIILGAGGGLVYGVGSLFKQAAGTKTFVREDGTKYVGRDKADGTPDNRFDKTVAQAEALSKE